VKPPFPFGVEYEYRYRFKIKSGDTVIHPWVAYADVDVTELLDLVE
jgi:hypothetical protein